MIFVTFLFPKIVFRNNVFKFNVLPYMFVYKLRFLNNSVRARLEVQKRKVFKYSRGQTQIVGFIIFTVPKNTRRNTQRTRKQRFVSRKSLGREASLETS